MFLKKVISKNVTEICTFPLLLMFVKLVLLLIVLCAFLKNFLNGFEFSMKFCVFDTFFNFFKKNLFRSCLYFFQTLKPNTQKTAPNLLIK
jgi:hypothetical protein